MARHLVKGQPYVVGLLFGGGDDLNPGRPGRAAYRLAGCVPPIEAAGAEGFSEADGGGERRLAPLLRADELAALVDERRGGLEVLNDCGRVEAVEADQIRPHLVGEAVWLPLQHPVRDYAVRFDPLTDVIAQRREFPRLKGSAPRHLLIDGFYARPDVQDLAVVRLKIGIRIVRPDRPEQQTHGFGRQAQPILERSDLAE